MTPGADQRRAPEHVIGSVDRALRVLAMLRGQPAVTLTAVSRALDVAPSTAHRLLATLMHHDFVRQDAASRAYLPGRALLEIGLGAVGSLDIRRLARPELEALTRRLEETAHLVLRDRDRVLFLDTVESPRPVRVTDRTGITLPAHCAAGGKVLLAQLTPEEVSATVGPGPLARMTPRTRTEVAQLHRELCDVREAGYATNVGESEPGLSAVAAAIPDPRGISTLSVSVSMPSEHVDDARVGHIAAAVIAAAQRIGALAAGDGGRHP
jgi:DNA-binding IclR family transcriptional regulator